MTVEQILSIAGLLSNAQEHITLGRKVAAIEALNNAKQRLFLEQYFSEFETIDGENRHPDGNFEEWMKARNSFLAVPNKKSKNLCRD